MNKFTISLMMNYKKWLYLYAQLKNCKAQHNLQDLRKKKKYIFLSTLEKHELWITN
jgi:hypothetical protein